MTRLNSEPPEEIEDALRGAGWEAELVGGAPNGHRHWCDPVTHMWCEWEQAALLIIVRSMSPGWKRMAASGV